MTQSGSEMPKTLTAENKRLYKKSLAKMMTFWIINTRKPLLDRLTKGQHDLWKQDLPHFASAFVDKNGKFEDVEWNQFFEHARLTIKNPFMQMALDTMNNTAFESWVQRGPDGQIIDLDCPSDEALDFMYNAFAVRVDALPE